MIKKVIVPALLLLASCSYSSAAGVRPVSPSAPAYVQLAQNDDDSSSSSQTTTRTRVRIGTRRSPGERRIWTKPPTSAAAEEMRRRRWSETHDREDYSRNDNSGSSYSHSRSQWNNRRANHGKHRGWTKHHKHSKRHHVKKHKH